MPEIFYGDKYFCRIFSWLSADQCSLLKLASEFSYLPWLFENRSLILVNKLVKRKCIEYIFQMLTFRKAIKSICCSQFSMLVRNCDGHRDLDFTYNCVSNNLTSKLSKNFLLLKTMIWVFQRLSKGSALRQKNHSHGKCQSRV